MEGVDHSVIRTYTYRHLSGGLVSTRFQRGHCGRRRSSQVSTPPTQTLPRVPLQRKRFNISIQYGDRTRPRDRDIRWSRSTPQDDKNIRTLKLGQKVGTIYRQKSECFLLLLPHLKYPDGISNSFRECLARCGYSPLCQERHRRPPHAPLPANNPCLHGLERRSTRL